MAYPIKDTGNRREFETGAVRDISTGKGRCDLMPLKVVGEVLDAGMLATSILTKIGVCFKASLLTKVVSVLPV